MSTPTTDQFLSAIAGFLRAKNALQIRSYILVEPPLPDIYSTLATELRRSFSQTNGPALERKCNDLLPEDPDRGPNDEQGTSWPAFVSFMKEYLEYIRDVNVQNLVETHQVLSGLVNQCITAMSNPSMGIVVLPTCLQLSGTLAKLAVNLERKPELTAHLLRRKSMANVDDDPDSKKTLVENTAELLQRGFTICLTERTSNPSGLLPGGRPEGKKVGIYSFANLVLKLLFQCRKPRLASQLFTNITQQSPPLAAFPAAQRVTYLYYLGRFCFFNNQFNRARLALEAANSQCHVRCLNQRTLLLTYLVATNIILGRFPTSALLQRPEASELGPKFWPLCQAIVKGDLTAFKRSFEGEHKHWFIDKGILLPLRNRCEIIVWRSLARRTFILNGVPGGESRRAPTFSLDDLLQLAQYLERRSNASESSGNAFANGSNNHNLTFGAQRVAAENFSSKASVDPDLSDASSEELENEDDDEDSEYRGSSITLFTTEAILASLIDQGLLHGFLSHKLRRFAILGAKTKGALNAGFPNVWSVLSAKGEETAVPGWVREDRKPPGIFGAGAKFGPGMVVNLSGARPVGSS
ncbi:MAG: hypothetical protein M1833_006776 [Piccolia ochrophora]|nr:MAG: hypothetical protein M1833_006776 [Piccolia ochrophora]